MTGAVLTRLSLAQRISWNTRRRPIVKLTARKASVPSTAFATEAMSSAPCEARLKMTAMMTQPMVSSMTAVATMIWPTLRRMKFISRTTTATIFTEEIDSAVPMNSEATRRACGSGSRESGRNSPSAKPQAKGTRMPAIEIAMAALPTFFTSLRSVSMPVSSSKSRMPTCAMPSIIAFCSGVFGKIAACASGQIQPNSDGPRMMPASSSPITEGWPIRCMISPRPRPTAISSTICATSRNSDGPAALPVSAPAAMVVSISAARASPAGRSKRHGMQ